jgi:formylglycine-generating enzyme required for sulfatase activity
VDSGLAIDSPTEGRVLAANTVEVRGRLSYEGDYEKVEVTAGGKRVQPVAGGIRWMLSALSDGPQSIEVTVRLEGEVEVSEQRGITVDTTKPKLEVVDPKPDAWVKPDAEVRGTVEDTTAVTVLVDGEAADFEAAVPGSAVRACKRPVSANADGERTVAVKARDAAGNESETVSLRLRVDGTKPELAVIDPADAAVVNSSRLTVRGTARDASLASVTVNEAPAALAPAGWSADLELREGRTALRVEARDSAGNAAEATRTVTLDSMKPKLVVLEPKPDAWVKPGAELRGTVEDATDVTVLVDGEAATLEPAATAGAAVRVWKQTLSASADGERTVTVKATDAAGNEAETSRRIMVRRTPPEREVQGFTFLARNPQGYPEYRHEKTGLVFVLLPGGTFLMGGTPEEEDTVREKGVPAADREKVKEWLSDEKPRHRVTLGPFLIAKYEVTQGQWEQIVNAARREGKLSDSKPLPSYFANGGKNLPVENVSWEECKALCDYAGLELPTEAQWEYACRAGSDTPIYSGVFRIVGICNSPDLDAIAWYAGNSAATYEGALDSSGWQEKQFNHTKAGPQPVGKKQPNAFGLYDMLGNVWEWCFDVYDGEFYKKPEATEKDPKSEAGSGYRVLRGGSWVSGARGCRSAYRVGFAASFRWDYAGFRPALSRLPPE